MLGLHANPAFAVLSIVVGAVLIVVSFVIGLVLLTAGLYGSNPPHGQETMA